MVYYIIHKCSNNNNTFGALCIRFTLKILLKTLVYAQFCSKFKFLPPFIWMSHLCHQSWIMDLRCVLVKTSLSRLSQILWCKIVYSVVRRIVRYLLWINQHHLIRTHFDWLIVSVFHCTCLNCWIVMDIIMVYLSFLVTCVCWMRQFWT